MIKKFEDGLVSIIMPAYNAKNTILKSIESVLSQTYPKWELIIVDDYSVDGTYDLIKKRYKEDVRIKIIKNNNNLGVARSRNKALDRARGQFIAFLDSDDVWKKDKLIKQLEFMKNESLWMCVSGYDIYEDGKFIKEYMPPYEIDYEMQLKGSRIGTLTVMIDQSLIGHIQMPKHGHEDYITWTKLIKEKGGIRTYPESLAIYNRSNDGLSSNKLKAANWQYKIYKTYFKISFPKRIYYFLCYTYNGFIKHI